MEGFAYVCSHTILFLFSDRVTQLSKAAFKSSLISFVKSVWQVHQEKIVSYQTI